MLKITIFLNVYYENYIAVYTVCVIILEKWVITTLSVAVTNGELHLIADLFHFDRFII